jgi:hypothetical protein
MQHGLVVHVRLRAAMLAQALDEARATVGVHVRIDDDHELVEQLARGFGAVGGEVMDHGERASDPRSRCRESSTPARRRPAGSR